MSFDKLKNWVRNTVQRTGFDVVRFLSLNTVLSHHGINVVFDVGANVGQFGTRLRELGYRGKIVSFEPQSQPFAELQAAAQRDGNWTAVNVGLGSEAGQQTINVYDMSVLSSIHTLNRKLAFPWVQQTGTESIEIRTLDSLFDQYVEPGDRVFLKIDTQGFEKQVLQGAEQSLPRVAGLHMELSLTPIYDEQPRLEEMVAQLRASGFALWQFHRGLRHGSTGQEMEIDGVFMRPTPANG